jgi:hypothetical protein
MRNVSTVVLTLRVEIKTTFSLEVNAYFFTSNFNERNVKLVAVEGRNYRRFVNLNELEELFESCLLGFFIEDHYLTGKLSLGRI